MSRTYAFLVMATLALVSCKQSAPTDPFLGLGIVQHLHDEHGIVVAYQSPCDILLTKTGSGVVVVPTAAGLKRVAPRLIPSLKAGWPTKPVTPDGLESALNAYDGAVEAGE